MIKIIFSDMDGTLLNENNQLPKDFDKTIDELKKHNVIFAPTSGRQYSSLIKTFAKYENDFIFLAENGTMITQNGKEIFSSTMDLNMALDVLNTGINFENSFSVFCGKKNAYVLRSQIKPDFEKYFFRYFAKNRIVDNFTEVIDLPIKLSFFDETGNAAQNIYPKLKQFSGTFQVVLASNYWVDVMNPDINKGVAVKRVQEILKITPDECAAFGDYLNDIQMLQSVTHSFAMDNAHSELKKIARYITADNDKDGVLVGIKQLIANGLIQ